MALKSYSVSDSSDCVIEQCSNLGTELICISEPNSDEYVLHYVCHRCYEELMTRYYEKQNLPLNLSVE